jgi:rhodanese-related sulfurtransferase
MSKSYKLKKVIVKDEYKFLAVILVLLAAGLLLLPKYEKHEGIKPELLLGNAVSSERYISTDELAEKIINQDPSFLLIDVRDEESYAKYSIPNSINIPLAKLLDEDSESYLNQDEFDVVLFSNDNFYANQAWLLCNRLEFKNLRVLNGGVNNWYNTIINPVKPTENQAAIAFKLYSFRKAASMYFGVSYLDQVISPTKKTAPKKVITVRKKKKKVAEGGC